MRGFRISSVPMRFMIYLLWIFSGIQTPRASTTRAPRSKRRLSRVTMYYLPLGQMTAEYLDDLVQGNFTAVDGLLDRPHGELGVLLAVVVQEPTNEVRRHGQDLLPTAQVLPGLHQLPL